MAGYAAAAGAGLAAGLALAAPAVMSAPAHWRALAAPLLDAAWSTNAGAWLAGHAAAIGVALLLAAAARCCCCRARAQVVRVHGAGGRPAVLPAVACGTSGARLGASAGAPPAFPNGWYFVCWSDELPRGSARAVSVAGAHVALFRGTSGAVGALHAFCPHMGANLAVGGVVGADALTCPFHGWSFDATGRCVDVRSAPSGAPPPRGCDTTAHEVRERNRQVYVWADAEGRPPSYELPEVVRAGAVCHGRATHTVAAHIAEMPENGADIAHLGALHGPLSVPPGSWAPAWARHRWTAAWAPCAEAPHTAVVRVEQWLEVAGARLPGTTVRAVATQVGPGFVAQELATPLGTFQVLETVTPVEALLQRATHTIFSPWYIPRALALSAFAGYIIQYERDVVVWNNKAYVPRPRLVAGDGPIMAFRRWFGQFYSEHSVSVPDALRTRAWTTAMTDW